MTFKQAVEEIKKGNKVKHKSWDSLMVTEFSNNIVCLEDERSYYYPYDLEDFKRTFMKFKNGWVLVSDDEYKNFFNNWR